MTTWQRSVSAAAVGVLGAGLLTADVAVLVALAAGSSGDPHGYVAIFGVLALATVLPPTAFAVAAFVGLLRNRAYGYGWALAAHSWVVIGALLFLWANSSSPGADGLTAWEVVVPGVLVAFGAAAVLVGALGWRGAGRSDAG